MIHLPSGVLARLRKIFTSHGCIQLKIVRNYLNELLTFSNIDNFRNECSEINNLDSAKSLQNMYKGVQYLILNMSMNGDLQFKVDSKWQIFLRTFLWQY